MLLDGKKLSKQIRLELKEEVKKLKEKGVIPGLAVILVGDDPASRIYVNNKKKACEELGIHSEEFLLPSTTTQGEILELIHTLNMDDNIHGILAQLPLPVHIDPVEVANAISPGKDVDCFNQINVGRLCDSNSMISPCTPAGIVRLLKSNGVEIAGRSCTIVGRSDIVGKPLALMMLHEDATVTICHSKTKNLKDFCKDADILISAVGKAGLITEDFVKDGAVVVDVGMNRMLGGKLCGDVDFDNVKGKTSAITPVPGGVGPMTIAMLMDNLVKLSKNNI